MSGVTLDEEYEEGEGFPDEQDDDRAVQVESIHGDVVEKSDAMQNGEIEERSSDDPSGEDGEETVEVPKQRLEDLEKKVEGVKETVDSLEEIVGLDVFDAYFENSDHKTERLAAVVHFLREDLAELEYDVSREEKVVEPKTKKAKAKKGILENWSEWSFNSDGDRAVATRINDRGKKRTRGAKKSVQKWLRRWMDEKYDEGIHDQQVYEVLDELGRTDEFRLEKKGRTRFLYKE